jgi:hypothetical protein
MSATAGTAFPRSLPNLPHAYPIDEHAVVRGRFVQQAPVDATANIARFFALD